MDLFSSNAENSIMKILNNDYDEDLLEVDFVELFDLNKCELLIGKHDYSKVCLQFPDNLLQFSVRVALWLEKRISQKVYVLGDTSYGSCCVDELAAEHINADLVIHFGHACLSPTARLPVHYVLPRASLAMNEFVSAFARTFANTPGSILVLYDVAYSHLSGEVRHGLGQFEDKVVVSRLCVPGISHSSCSTACEVSLSGHHSTSLLGRGYCCAAPSAVIYITHKHSQNMINFAVTLRDVPFFTYSQGEIENVDFNKALRRRLYLVEKIKDVKTIGIVVGTLSVEKFLGAIERVKRLAKYRGKRCYVFSVGKPNPAKLANFPEIELFVLVSCPEACVENDREYLQPVVTLLEAELALNSERQWNDPISVDFRDLIEGGSHYKPLPDGQEPLSDVSLISNRIRPGAEDVSCTGDPSNQLSTRGDFQISSYNTARSWRGLEQALGETPVSIASLGRSGLPIGYQNEKEHQTS